MANRRKLRRRTLERTRQTKRRYTLSRTLAERFASFCAEPNENGCTIWQGQIDAHGYGRMTLSDGRPRCGYAHRIAVELATSKPLPNGIVVRHRCPTAPNKRCVNVLHLDLGTGGDNRIDALLDGTFRRCLANSEIEEIKRLRDDGWTLVAIAKLFRVTESAICKIVKGRYNPAWRLPEPI